MSPTRFSRRAACLSALAAAAPLPPELYAFDNGTGRDQKLPLEDQAALLHRAGYAGMAVYTGTARIPELLAALDARNLRLLSIYVHSRVDDAQPRIDAGIPDAIKQLHGRQTMLMLTVQGHHPQAEARAVENLQRVADLAAASSLNVCLYPHVNFYLETTPDALRLIAQANRPNLRAALNFHHSLWFHATRCGSDDLHLEHVLANPSIALTSLNGIRRSAANWDIVPLGQGNIDPTPFIAQLRRSPYRGPVAIQCYRAPGDLEANLRASLAAWRNLTKSPNLGG